MDEVMQWIAANAEIPLDSDGDTWLHASVTSSDSRPPGIFLDVRDVHDQREHLFEVPWERVKALIVMLEAAQAQRDRDSLSET